MIYIDNNATTFLIPAVRARIEALMAAPIGNPSSPYRLGAEARSELEQARDQVADALGTRADCILFVASGSEANAMALATVQSCEQQRDEILVSEVEHSSVTANATLLGGRGYTVRYIPVDGNGRIDLDRLAGMLGLRTAIVSVQWVNNETGVTQPVEEIAALCHHVGALYHCDAAQAFGKVPLDLDAQVGADLVTVTAHKINGPTGVGALYARDPALLRPLVGGGDQERGLRGGTENLIGAVGFGTAAAERMRTFASATALIEECRDTFEQAVLTAEPRLLVNGDRAHRVGNTSNLQFPGIDGAMLVAALDEQEVYCSQSSACTTARPTPSHVLTAMGLTETEAYASLRFSFGVLNTVEEAQRAAGQVVASYQDLVERLHRLGVA
ncbi:MAG: cysteine desulfurase family protein [Spirochaetaceae bacterium]|nr:cysteine desulfurase family protein [Spirochaetaceae bacterium]